MYRLAIICLLTFVLTSCTTTNNTPPSDAKIAVAVAASLMLSMQDIGNAFEREYPVKVELSPASSGVLTAQIMHGAPFDVFISADATYPAKLEKEGKTVGTPKTFAMGLLVLWSKTELGDKSPAALLSESSIRKISIANPELAPFGAASVRWLHKENIYSQLKPKLVYGENIGSVNQFIESGAVDAALTSVSAMSSPQLRDKGHWAILPASKITGIPHVAAVIQQHPSRNNAQRFLEFLSSDSAAAILDKYGYAKPQNP